MRLKMGKTMGLLAAALLPLAGVAEVRLAAGARSSENNERSGQAHISSLMRVRPDAELKQELVRYGLKAYSCTDGMNVVRALHYAPKAAGAQEYPVIVFLPGNGERGDLIRQFRQRRIFDIVTDADFQRRHPCHLIALSPPEWAGTLVGGSPECPSDLQRLLHDTVLKVVKVSATGVDLKRLYLTGFSYGGTGAYALAQHYPGEYAAVVPIDAYPPSARYFKADRPGNWWHFHSEHRYDDYPEVMTDLKEYQTKTNEAGGDFRVSVYPATGHDAWHRAWDEEVWTWMFGKTTTSPIQGVSVPPGTVPIMVK